MFTTTLCLLFYVFMRKNSSDSSNAWLFLITNQHHHKTAHLPATLQTLSLIPWPIFSPPFRILFRCSVLSFVQYVPILLLSKVAFDKGVCQCFCSNFVVFRPRQKRTNYRTCIRIPNNNNTILASWRNSWWC